MFTKEKYCVLPGQEPIRLASTSGHVTFVGETPTVIPTEFEREALGRGACTEERLNELKAKLAAATPAAGGQAALPLSEEDQKKAAAIQTAIVELIAGAKADDFDKSGKPTVEALKAKLGFAVTAAERDAALAVIKG